MGRWTTAWQALTGELDRQFRALGITTARQVERRWVIRTAGQGRGRRWWVHDIRGPAGMQGLVKLHVQLVELHGVRARSRLTEMGVDPDQLEEIYLDADALVVIEYLDWHGADNRD